MEYAKLLTDTVRFERELSRTLIDLGIYEKCLKLQMDHICVRLNDDESVLGLKAELEEVGEVISDAVVFGRVIYIIQLFVPLDIGPWQVSAIELPHPKPNQTYLEGWEHVEFVLQDVDNEMEALTQAFDTRFPTLKRGYIQTLYKRKDNNINIEGDQMPNPTIGLVSGNIGVKFHPRSIQEVIGYHEPSH